MIRLSSSLDNRLTTKTFSLRETKIPKTTLTQKIHDVLSTSMLSPNKDKGSGWRSKSVMPTQIHVLKSKLSLKLQGRLEVEPLSPLDLPKRAASMRYSDESPQKKKFHLLPFQRRDSRQQRKQKSVDRQVSKWNNRNSLLKTMIPPPQQIVIPPPTRIPKVPIQRQRINILIESIRANIQYFWNIFQNAAKITNLMKSLDGYNLLVHSVLFRNDEFVRLSSQECVQKYFQAFREEAERSEDYIDKDIKLYTSLLFYNLKMEQKVDTLQREFTDKSQQGIEQNLKVFEQQNLKVSRMTKQPTKYDTLHFLAQQRTFICNFKKGEAVRKLQELGIKVSINEKVKDKVLTSKEAMSSNCAESLVKLVSPYIIHTSKF